MLENEKRLAEIEKELGQLPEGNITYKNIRGAKRMYFKGKYIKSSDESVVITRVERRKKLLLEKEAILSGNTFGTINTCKEAFETNVVMADSLIKATGAVLKYGYRECSQILHDYLRSDCRGKVCIIYGLRRTGKSTMILQEIANLPMIKTAYIKILSSNNMSQLNHDLQILSELNYEYVFIDEVTLMKDFIDSASLLSDVYAMQGMKIVLSGTDSLGFAISSREELYDRAVMIHTTFIPFREYSNLLNIHDVDKYIRYGGTFRMGEVKFGNKVFNDESVSFRDDESTRRYIDTAIAKNIQHSLSCYQNGGHFRHLLDLYEADELTGAVNRIIEDMNHRFVLSVLTKDFESHDLGSSRQIERKRAAVEGKNSILDQIDVNLITKELMSILEIKNVETQTVEVNEDHVYEIKQYLKMLDLVVDCPIEGIGTQTPVENIVFSQPGMRYCQAQALVYLLMQNAVFKSFTVKERKEVCNLILDEVKGRMLEEIILLETIKAKAKHFNVFKLMFEVGEIDMLVADTDNLTCELYEIKHSAVIDSRQYKNLVDAEKLRAIEHQYGSIVGRNVLYRGDEDMIDGIRYINVGDYLKFLNK